MRLRCLERTRVLRLTRTLAPVTCGEGPGPLDWGHDIAGDRQGNFYVVGVRGEQVQKFRAP